MFVCNPPISSAQEEAKVSGEKEWKRLLRNLRKIIPSLS
jgi:hypothetical protein